MAAVILILIIGLIPCTLLPGCGPCKESVYAGLTLASAGRGRCLIYFCNDTRSGPHRP